MNNKNVKQEEDSPWKWMVLVLACNYALAGILYLFIDSAEGEFWIIVLWPIVAFIGYAAIVILREFNTTPVVIMNPEAINNINAADNSNLKNVNINNQIEIEKQKIRDLTLQLESKDILIAHMQKEIEVYQNQVTELIKKIK